MNDKKILSCFKIFVFIAVLLSSILVVDSLATQNENNELINVYGALAIIEIYGNDDFDPTIWNKDGKSDGTSCYPWILDDYEFKDVRYGIIIAGVDDYFIIRNCSFKNTEDEGISMGNTKNGLICNNTFEACGGGIVLSGMALSCTSNNRICDNTFEGCGKGISLKGVEESNYIYSNYFLKNGVGIAAADTSHIYIYSNLMVFDNISIYFNVFVKHSTISYNTIGNSTSDGIRLERSSWNEISRNNFENNTEYGVKLINSSCNDITQNNFYGNNLYGEPQGYDDLNTTSWSRNYWNDLLTDDSYIIDGPGGNKDYTPSKERIDIGTIDCSCVCDRCDFPVPTSSPGLIFSISSITMLALCVYIKRKKFN